jgi:hypothetical protein
VLLFKRHLNEIKLIGKEIEICQIDCTISTHGETNAALFINTMTKTKKKIVLLLPPPYRQLWVLVLVKDI